MKKNQPEWIELHNINDVLSIATIQAEYDVKRMREKGIHCGVAFDIILKRLESAKRARQVFEQLDTIETTQLIEQVLENE